METRGRTTTQARATPCGHWSVHRSAKVRGISAGRKVKAQCRHEHDTGTVRWQILTPANVRIFDNRWAAEAFVEAKNEAIKEASE